VVTDLILGVKGYHFLKEFHLHVREKYDAEAGFITMNLPLLIDVLRNQGIENPIVCANINKIGFRMCGGVEKYQATIATEQARVIAMSVLASGAIPPREAFEWVCNLRGVDSIVFGASSKANIIESKKIIDECWGSDLDVRQPDKAC
jgi:hypothetical protein